MKGILFILCFFPFLSFSQHPLEKRTSQLEEYFSKSYSDPDSSKYRLLFFDVFPDNFDDYSRIYGEHGALNPQAYKHVVQLFSSLSDLVGKEKYYNKIIGISIGARYTTEIGFFHYGVLWKKVREDPVLIIKLLESKTDKELVTFFSFLFDAVHPVNEIPEEFYFVKDSNERMYSQMTKALKAVAKSHENNSH